MDCRWSFSSNAVIELVFVSFSTESSVDCVSVYDGGSLSSPLIRKMSGSSLPPPITSSSINLYVKFSSDGTNTYDGFVAAYRGKARHKVTQDGFDNSKLPCPRRSVSKIKSNSKRRNSKGGTKKTREAWVGSSNPSQTSVVFHSSATIAPFTTVVLLTERLEQAIQTLIL